MVYGRCLILFCIIGLACSIDLAIKSNEKPVLLKPEVGVKTTKWSLKSPSGSRMVIACQFNTKKCDESRIAINLGNNKKFETCVTELEDDEINFRNTTDSNTGEVTIKHNANKLMAFCQAEATKPYLNDNYKSENSVEHGLEGRNLKKDRKCRCGWSNKKPQRVINGVETQANEFPFIVRLRIPAKKTTFCGGSIVTPKAILTAAHCLVGYEKETITILAGGHNLKKPPPAMKEVTVVKQISHANYDPDSQLHDIALLILEKALAYNDEIGPVCMPTTKENLIGNYIKAMGWGLIAEGGKSSDVLRKVNLKVIDSEICAVTYGRTAFNTQSQVCTYFPLKDVCEGDSGGPLVKHDLKTKMFRQVAVVSYGAECATLDPGVTTDVYYYLDWIKKNIKDNNAGILCY